MHDLLSQRKSDLYAHDELQLKILRSAFTLKEKIRRLGSIFTQNPPHPTQFQLLPRQKSPKQVSRLIHQCHRPSSRSNSNPSHTRKRELVRKSSEVDGSAERLYCICQKASYGEMIACDNSKCELEWFHFACVGVKIQPEGQWFCPRCRDKSSEAMRPDIWLMS